MAKGTITGWSCDPSTNGLATAKDETDYILGASGQPVTELAQNADGSMNWQRTYVYAGAALIATYNPSPNPANQPLPSFRLTDWLGTMRATTDSSGVLQGTCAGLPYGDSVPCQGNIPDPHYFTGKERDSESGNDFFGARYYSSALARWLSPDWSAKEEPVPYAKLDDPQTLNLYAYVGNNPMMRFDADGHQQGQTGGGAIDDGGNKMSTSIDSNKSYNMDDYFNRDPVPLLSNGMSNKRSNFQKFTENGVMSGWNSKTQLWKVADDGTKTTPTIAWGHKVMPGEDFSKGLTMQQADALYLQDLAHHQQIVMSSLKIVIDNKGFESLVDLAFNTGNSNNRPTREYKNGAKPTLADYMHYATSAKTHQVMPGLGTRRTEDYQHGETGVTPKVPIMP